MKKTIAILLITQLIAYTSFSRADKPSAMEFGFRSSVYSRVLDENRELYIYSPVKNGSAAKKNTP